MDLNQVTKLTLEGPFIALDSYISPQVLPKEKIVGFVKWDPSVVVDSITIKMEADVFIERILNIAEESFSSYSPLEGRFEILRRYIQIPGYVGFVAYYDSIPNEERRLGFRIDFALDGGEHREIELSTNLVRPLLKLINPIYEINAGPSIPSPPPILLALENGGHATIKIGSTRPIVKTTGLKGLKITTETCESAPVHENLVIARSPTSTSSRMAITGKGYGMIVIECEYADELGNVYKTPVSQILIKVEEYTTVNVPIANRIEEKVPLVLTPVSAT